LNLLDASSPFAIANGKRLNITSTRDIKLIDRENEISVGVTYEPDGSYKMQLPGVKEPMNVQGKLNGDELIALIGDTMVTSTVAVNDKHIHLFSARNDDFTVKISHKDYSSSPATKGSLFSPMPGKIVKVMVVPNQKVTKGTPLMILWAMKMEHCVRSPVDGVVEKINYDVNDEVQEQKLLLSIKETN